MLYLNNFSVMLGHFPVLILDAEDKFKCLAIGHKAVPPMSLEPATPRFQVNEPGSILTKVEHW